MVKPKTRVRRIPIELDELLIDLGRKNKLPNPDKSVKESGKMLTDIFMSFRERKELERRFKKEIIF